MPGQEQRLAVNMAEAGALLAAHEAFRHGNERARVQETARQEQRDYWLGGSWRQPGPEPAAQAPVAGNPGPQPRIWQQPK